MPTTIKKDDDGGLRHKWDEWACIFRAKAGFSPTFGGMARYVQGCELHGAGMNRAISTTMPGHRG